jgi:tetratricopeptide (TPR) repeat protein
VSGSRAHAAASPILLGVVLAGVAFGAGGGTQLGRASITEVVLIVLCGGIVAAAVLFAPGGPLYGGTSLLAFALLAAVTAFSITWSIAPDLSYVEAGRMLAYLAAFAAAVAGARLAPRAAPVALKGVLLAATAVVVYSLATRIWPGSLAPDELSNRLGEPFGYWNAVGTTAAMAVPGALWLGARRSGSPAGRALAYPALGMAVVAILLTQSRGALGAALVGAALWFLIVPLRLRSLPVALLPPIAAAPVSAWALSKDPFSKSLQPLAAKESVAGEFGLLLLLTAVVLLAVGFAVNLGLSRQAPSMRVRRGVGVVAVAGACLVPLVLFTSVAFSQRGLGGTFNDRVDELTSANDAAPGEGAARLTAASNTRGKYWREAGKIFSERSGLGTGAGTFAVARLRFRTDDAVSRHAHGFVPQTLADTGLLGLAASLALLAAWLAAAVRTTGLTPRLRRFRERARRRDWDSERIALVGLTLVPIVFGLQSIIDWTWFVPGPAVLALTAAGFVAARGPVGALAGAGPALAGVPVGGEPRSVLGGLPRPSFDRILLAAGIVVCALLFAWAGWLPEASDRDSNRAQSLSAAGHTAQARAEADKGAKANPLTPEPLVVKGALETKAGDLPAAQKALERAVLSFPGEPEPWLNLASFQLGTRNDPAAALDTVEGALYLDPRSQPGRQLFLEARAALRAKQERAAGR